MLNDIHDILDRLAGGAPTAQLTASEGAEFEMWLLLRIAERLRGAPFNAELRASDGAPIPSGGTFALMGHKKIGSGASCHVGFEWKSQLYELHANIEFRGRSGETHEIDLCAIPSSVADELRSFSGGGRPTGFPRFAVECKFKPATATRDETRQCVARLFDLHFLAGHDYPSSGAHPSIWPGALVAKGAGRRRIYYSQSFAWCFNALCRIGKVTAPGGRFLAFNSVVPFHDLRPGRPQLDIFLDRVETFFRSSRPY